MTEPPNELPRYRLLTGPDDDKFCHRVSEALDTVIVARALLWPDLEE